MTGALTSYDTLARDHICVRSDGDHCLVGKKTWVIGIVMPPTIVIILVGCIDYQYNMCDNQNRWLFLPQYTHWSVALFVPGSANLQHHIWYCFLCNDQFYRCCWIRPRVLWTFCACMGAPFLRRFIDHWHRILSKLFLHLYRTFHWTTNFLFRTC